MKFSCERAILQGAVATVSRAAATKTSIPALEGILLEAGDSLSLTGYNLETGIHTSVPADIRTAGRVVLSARLFGEMLRRLPDDVVTIHVERETAHITCGMSEYHIQCIPADEFPELPAVESEQFFSIPQSALRAMISQTLFAVSVQDVRPIHTGSLFEIDETGLTIVSLDGFRLALRNEPILNPGEVSAPFSFVVPGPALSEVEKICADSDTPVTVMQGKRHILFQIEETVLITRRLEGEFLNYRQSLPKQSNVTVLVEAKSLISSIERVSLILNDKIKPALRCVFSKNLLIITSRATTGSAADQCVVEGDGGGLEIGFDNRYLADALKAAPAERVRLELGSAVSPCVVLPEEGSRFLYLVLPVRLKSGE